MKFPLLPVGQRFAFEGEIYTKAGPMTARRERDGGQRLIPRSAAVAPAESLGAASPPASGALGPAARTGAVACSAALDAYEAALRGGLAALDADLPGRLDPLLERARTAFRAALGE